MAEKPILFSGPMVRAILAGKKTQTRRVVKPQPLDGLGYMMGREKKYIIQCGEDWPDDARDRAKIPYQPGDTLWVREMWGWSAKLPISRLHDDCTRIAYPDLFAYRADAPAGNWCWRSSIHMPRRASRLSLLVTEVRAQRVQDISEEDAQAEGANYVRPDGIHHHGWRHDYSDVFPTARASFAWHWDRINGKKHPWASNPWVFAYTFEIKERSKR